MRLYRETFGKFFVIIKIGVALNSPNINTQYVLMSQLGIRGMFSPRIVLILVLLYVQNEPC